MVLVAFAAGSAHVQASPVPTPSATDMTALDRFTDLTKRAQWYEMDIESYESIGTRTADVDYHYHREPGAGELWLRSGRALGASIVGVDGRTTVDASSSGGWLPRIWRRRIPANDPQVTSLRGNTVFAANLAGIAACLSANRSAIRELRGPDVDGTPTTAIVFDRHRSSCPGDAPRDRALTAEVLDVATATGVPLLRKRYVEREVVERWRVRDFVVERGPAG